MTNQQHPAQFDWATELLDTQGHITLSVQEAKEIGARLRRMGEKLKACEDLDGAASDMQLLRMGYIAARLEIESLQARIKTMAEEHADELMVAHLDGMRAEQPAGAQQPGVATWTPLPGTLPEPGKPVLLDIGMEYPIRAMWAAKHTLEVGMEDDSGFGEYDEATDTYYCPEGWYEWNEHEETHWAVDETHTAWCELPPNGGASHGQAPAQAAPAAVAGPSEFPHEQMDVMALARYKVVPSHESMFHRHAVVAGDGSQQLYIGREVECENMARKFAGAFLDGAFAFHSMLSAAPTPPAQAADSVLEDAARESEYRRGYRHGYEQRDAEVRGALA